MHSSGTQCIPTAGPVKTRGCHDLQKRNVLAISAIIGYDIVNMKERSMDAIESAARYEMGDRRVLLDYDVAVFFNVELESLRRIVQEDMGHLQNDLVIRLRADQKTDLLHQAPEGVRDMMMVRPPEYAFTVHGAYAASFFLDNATAVNYTHMILESFGLVRRIGPLVAGLLARVESLESRYRRHGKRLKSVVRAVRELEHESKAMAERSKNAGDGGPEDADVYLSARDRMELLRHEVLRLDRRRARQQEIVFFSLAVLFGVVACLTAIFWAIRR